MARVVQVFFDTDMRNSHTGLQKIARKNDIQIQTLDEGNFVVFINSKRTMIKIFAPSNVIAFYKSTDPHKRRIDLSVIPNIIRAFRSSGKLDYDASLKKVLEEKLGPTRTHL